MTRKTRVVVTRAAHQAEALAKPLRDHGFEVILLPTVAIEMRAVEVTGPFDWIVFTSANAVRAVDPQKYRGAKVAAVGPGTRAAAEAAGFAVSLVPDKYVADALAASFAGEGVEGKRILIPAAAVSRDIVAETLRNAGAEVVVDEAYRNICPPGLAHEAAAALRDPLPDWITFASPSAFEHLLPLTGKELLGRMKIATIGPVTSAAVREAGLSVAVEANPHSVEGLVSGLAGALAF